MKKLLDKKIIQCKIIMRSLSAMLKIIGNKIGTLIRKKALSLMLLLLRNVPFFVLALLGIEKV